MRRAAPLVLVMVFVAACGSGRSASSKPRPTHVAQAQPSASVRSAVTPAPPQPQRTAVVTQATPAVLPPAPTPTSPYLAFLAATCRAFASANPTVISNELPYYQYNSGLRYGMLGDGEGQTGDPSLLGTWLQGGTVRCQDYTPDVAGHGTLLVSGWKQPGGWSLIELDTFNGAWKINDFTFGDRRALYHAMQTSQPILPYHGR